MYLTWIVRRLAARATGIAPEGTPADAPSRGDTSAMTDVFSQRCQNVRNRTIRSTARVLPMIGFLKDVADVGTACRAAKLLGIKS